MKTLLALLALTTSALATVKQITITGHFDHGSNTELLNDPLQPFTLTAGFEVSAYDWDDRATLGIYYFPDQFITLDFGGYRFRAQGVVVRVFNGDSGLWGVTVGNLNPLEEFGLFIPDGTGIYTVGFATSAVFTTDGLENVTAGNLGSLPLNYALIEGSVSAANDAHFRVQDSGTRETVIADVPEPGAIGLIFAAAILLSGWRARWISPF
jgi:hypothetical protein